mgnify:CR=1 FL=1|tara:strand:- start:8 stop:370 length:363 start_codon:yes stop_codon:yes gene_type:complete
MQEDSSDILIVKPFWADKLLSGEKTMEIRGQPCLSKLNQTIFISKSGTQKVYGSLVIDDCIGPLTSEEFESFHEMHKVSAASPYKKTYGWICSNPILFDTPISYVHKKGAIIWLKYKAVN